MPYQSGKRTLDDETDWEYKYWVYIKKQKR